MRIGKKKLWRMFEEHERKMRGEMAALLLEVAKKTMMPEETLPNVKRTPWAPTSVEVTQAVCAILKYIDVHLEQLPHGLSAVKNGVRVFAPDCPGFEIEFKNCEESMMAVKKKDPEEEKTIEGQEAET